MEARPCSHRCGWTAFGDFPTCCKSCKGADGPHSRDCETKNSRVRPARPAAPEVRPVATEARQCCHGCGWSAFGDYITCCTECGSPDGPHARDCPSKNVRVRPACDKDCGRPAFGTYSTCCTRCKGASGPHAPDCADKCIAAAAESSSVGCIHAPGRPLGTDGTIEASGRRRAVLIGINYVGTGAQLRGCVNDVTNIERLLTQTFGWDPSYIRKLTDDGRNTEPTRHNIEKALRWLVHGARSGDVFFLHYSGHGAEQPDPNGYEENGMNQTILPVDFKRAGMMTDDEIHSIVVKPLPEGARLTAVLDCCHSGTGLDLPWRLSKTHGWREETNPYHCPADVQLFSGCEDDQTSADAKFRYGVAGGAMTTAFCAVFREETCPGYVELMKRLYEKLREHGFSQRPLLTSTQRIDLDSVFQLDSIHPNGNPVLGRIFRRRFEPKPSAGPSELMGLLGIGLALGGILLDWT